MAKNSKDTSRNIIPSTFKKFTFTGKNIDYGGGKYDTATEYLKANGCKNYVFDPYNRSDEHNDAVWNFVLKSNFDSITCLNVLNVIKSKKERKTVLEHIHGIANLPKTYPVVYFQIYQAKKGNFDIQTGMTTNQHLEEIQKVFFDWHLEKRGNILRFTK